jgi:hypothetical protein
MSKIIKKQIERSLPLFLIFSLVISSTVVGVVFNLDFNRVDDEIKVSLSTTEVEAQDTASTTVEVLNAYPAIVVGQEPAEVPVSTSTSPINIGDSISFVATADDPEGNFYFLIVCTSPGATAANGSFPTCDGGAGNTLCLSASTTDATQSTCVDTALAATSSENVIWYAYACDDHATQADCSPVSQGNGADEDASPFFVNHAPTLDAVSTTDDSLVPGSLFEFTATSTDTDVAGGADQITLHICATNSYSTTTGCAASQELCTVTALSVADEAVLTCTWNDTVPTVDQNYSYWAFIKDWHDMPAAVGQGSTNTYTVINIAPVASAVVLNGAVPITLNLRGAPNTEVVVTATLTDNNGAADIVSATSSAFWSSAADSLNCAPNDNECYQITGANCSIFGLVGATANLQCTTTLEFFAVPTTAAMTNPNAATDWLAGATVYDEALSHQVVSVAGVEMNQTAGLDIEELYIPYNTIRGGENSGTYNATTTVVNYGNTPLDNDVSGTDMDHDVQPVNIPVANQKYGIIAGDYTAVLTTNLSVIDTSVDVIIDRPMSGVDVEDEIYWGINIPGGTISGNYEGTNTFTGAVDPDGNWN